MSRASAPPTPLGRFIVDTADANGWSIRRVAERGGLDPGTLRHYIRAGGWNGRRPIAQQTIEQIAAGLGVPQQRVLEKVLESTGGINPEGVTADQQIVLQAMGTLDTPAQRMLADVVLTIQRELLRRHSDDPGPHSA